MKTPEPHCPGTVAPERFRYFETHGAKLRAYEWGDPKAPAILCAHGFFDHGRGYDLMAPLLAERYRVVSVDARGHGESSRCGAYPWMMDVKDTLHILRELGPGTHLVGHSKGGGQMTDSAILAGDSIGKLVSLDGFGPPDDGIFARPGQPDFTAMSLPERSAHFLDQRKRAEQKLDWNPRPSLDDLVERRGQQNPLLDKTWLRYFVYHAAREANDGWRWKGDAMLTSGGFGPFRPDWIAPHWANLKVPMLAVIGSVQDHWGPLPKEMLDGRLAHVPQLERVTIEGAGHFIHMERPVATAEVILDFLEAA
ncbi:MAG: pimeloyl-ACP methyl ester carboxylesterase [Myxococcota bacterium]|jgi:pimeloyl-ACP methyl ester carboxylesterase